MRHDSRFAAITIWCQSVVFALALSLTPLLSRAAREEPQTEEATPPSG